MSSDTPTSPAEFLVISSSLHPTSRSRMLAQAAFQCLQEYSQAQAARVAWVDLAELPLPLCDGQTAYSHPNVGPLAAQIRGARGILIASPIYNFDVNAALKNVVELTSRAWQDKVVGLLCAAGGGGSYMSLMPFANSLMLDFRCLILPRFVYALGNAFTADAVQDPEVLCRIDQLAQRLVDVALAVPPPNNP